MSLLQQVFFTIGEMPEIIFVPQFSDHQWTLWVKLLVFNVLKNIIWLFEIKIFFSDNNYFAKTVSMLEVNNLRLDFHILAHKDTLT